MFLNFKFQKRVFQLKELEVRTGKSAKALRLPWFWIRTTLFFFLKLNCYLALSNVNIEMREALWYFVVVAMRMQTLVFSVLSYKHIFLSFSARFRSDWLFTVDRINITSWFIRWENLTRQLERRIPLYIVILNRKCRYEMFHEVTRGSKLTLQMNSPYAVSSCGVEVFGVDELGRLYMAKRGNTSGAKKKLCR